MSDELQLIKKIKSYNNYVDENVIINAYKYASELHKTQKRHSGDPYISHPVAVANILAELKLDGPTITTALLHDTIEDTKATYDEVKNNFGEEIADLVDGVTKISKLEVEKKTLTAGENFRKLILATSKDIRVLLVKLADRLHNIRTITSIDKKEKRERIAKETMEIYAPLAERMGMHKVRDELEDRSFAILFFSKICSISLKTSLNIFFLPGDISLTLFTINDLASSFNIANDLSSSSSLTLCIPILSANGA